ncbi:uncharacterized protein LOC143188471 [Calliopsis andreniformis]|uniref:uncharacterized protein LOC143188471 n=1 Tax=Calliopsis andreniformis TaxID=337506 RepID=UPI003FCCB482
MTSAAVIISFDQAGDDVPCCWREKRRSRGLNSGVMLDRDETEKIQLFLYPHDYFSPTPLQDSQDQPCCTRTRRTAMYPAWRRHELYYQRYRRRPRTRAPNL